MGKVLYIKDYLERNNKFHISVGSTILWRFSDQETVTESEVMNIGLLIPGTGLAQQISEINLRKVRNHEVIFFTKDNKVVWSKTVLGRKLP